MAQTLTTVLHRAPSLPSHDSHSAVVPTPHSLIPQEAWSPPGHLCPRRSDNPGKRSLPHLLGRNRGRGYRPSMPVWGPRVPQTPPGGLSSIPPAPRSRVAINPPRNRESLAPPLFARSSYPAHLLPSQLREVRPAETLNWSGPSSRSVVAPPSAQELGITLGPQTRPTYLRMVDRGLLPLSGI